MKIKKTFLKWIYILPLLIVLVTFFAIPLLFIFWLSLHYMPIGLQPIFIGLKNYEEVLKMPELYISIQKTLIYSFTAVFIKALIGLGIALLLSQEFKGRGILRGLAIIPYALPPFICAVIFWFVYYHRGIANSILTFLGFSPIYWLSYEFALPSVIFVNVWHGWPFFFLGFLAGLQAIPSVLYESASIDGASSIQKFRYITLPLLKPVFLIICSLSLMWTMGDFVIPWLMTGGGPLDATFTIPIASYKIAFLTRLNIPLATAYSAIILPIYLILIYYVIKELG
ncbi:MAG: sugar ABC transporter permease [Candidatus Methanomethylicia archaeon]